MDFAEAITDTGQSRYSLHINDSRAEPEVLRFRGREALSAPLAGVLSSPHHRTILTERMY